MSFSPEEWDSIVRTSAELRGQASRFNTSSDVPAEGGRLLSTAKAKQNEPNAISRFGAGAADLFRSIVPQGVRDVAGRGLRVATSAERTLNLGGSEGLGTDIGKQIERVPVAGGLLRSAFDIGFAPSTLLTAGKGGAIAAALRGGGAAGKIGAALVSPATNAPTFAGRLFSEVVMGTAASAAAEKVIEDTDSPLLAAAAGLAAGAVAGAGLNAFRGASRTFGRDAARHIPGPTDSRTFVRDLLPASEVAKGIDLAAPDSAWRSGLGRRTASLVNPGSVREGEIGVADLVELRQQDNGRMLAEAALMGAIDSHGDGIRVVAGPRGTVFNVDDVSGKILNIPGSHDLIDFLEQRRVVQLRGLRPEQQAFVKDLHQLLDERRAFRVANGLPVSKNPDEDIVHISRIVRGIRDVDDVGRTNEFIARVHETRAEGIAAGVRYENDLRATVGLMLQADYRQAAAKQLDQLLAPHVVTPSAVLAKTKPAVVQELRAAVKDLAGERRNVRLERRAAVKAATLSSQPDLPPQGPVMRKPDGTPWTQADADRFAVSSTYVENNVAINGALRRGDLSKWGSTVDSIDRLTAQPLPEDIRTVYRGVSLTAEDAAGLVPGVEIPQPIFLSTSRSPDTARYFAQSYRNGYYTHPVVMELSVPRGATGVHMPDLGRGGVARTEGEVLLPRGGSIRIAAVEDGGRRVVGEYMPPKSAASPRIRAENGPALTPQSQADLAAAQSRYAAAKTKYARAMDEVRASRVLPGYVFGNQARDVQVGVWKGKFLPTDADYLKLAERMDTLTGRPLPIKVSGAANLARQTGDLIRLASASGDAAAPFIHGLPLFGQSPKVWAKAAMAQYRGLIDPGRTGRYVRQNLETVQEMAQLGIPVGDIEQYISAAGGSGRIERVVQAGARTRVGRQTLGRLEAGYDNFLTVARVEAYKSLKPVWDGTPADLATYIRDLTGALSTKALGVSPGQRAFESIWLAFSPRLFRSTLALVAHAANPNDPVGRQAARSLLGLMGAAAVMAVGTNLAISGAKGETEEQAWKRVQETMDPTTGKFMSVDIGGQRLGVGGQIRAVTQFVAKALAHPSGFATADAFDNPLINFYMGRGSVGVNVAGSIIEGATGERVNVLPYESIDGLPDAALHLGSSLMPFVIQNQFEAHDISKIDRLVLGTTSLLGLNTSQKSPSDRINEEAQARYQKPYAELTGVEQQAIEADRADLFALRDKRREEFGDRETQQRYATLRAVDADRLASENATVDAYKRGQITGSQLRDELKSLQRDAAVQKRRVLGPIDNETSDANKQALTAWYDTFDQAKYPGTELLDWDKHAVLEAATLGAMTADQRRYVNERRVTKHDPSAQWFFDNEKTISNAGYYQKADIAFEKMRQMLPETIQSYSALVAAQGAATQAGDVRTTNFLKMVKNRVDALADRDRVALRRQNSDLDHALLENGRVSVLQPNNRARG